MNYQSIPIGPATVLNAGQVYACPGVTANLLAKNTLQLATNAAGPFTDAASSITEPGVKTLGGFARCLVSTIVEAKRVQTKGTPSPPIPSLTQTYGEVILADNPSHYWRLGELAGTVAVDLVGGSNGVISGGVTLGILGANANDKAMTFNGTTGFIQSTVAPLGSIFSIEAWVKTVSTSFMEIAEIDTIQFYVNGNQAGANVGGIGFNTFFPINDGGWHHVVLVSTGTVVAIYVDGVFKLSGLAVAVVNGTQFFIGRYWGSAVNFFNGSIDEVATYPYVLSLAKIREHYNTAFSSYSQRVLIDSPLAFWKLNDAGVTAIDSSGNGKNATYVGAVQFQQPGPSIQQAITINGTGYAELVAGLGITGAYSAEAWFKTTDPTGFPCIVGQDRFNSNAEGWQIFGDGGSFPGAFRAFAKTTAGAAVTFDIATRTVNTISYADGQWHHIVVTFNGTTGANGAKLYIDGALVVQGTPISATVGVPTVPLRIGMDCDGTAFPFKGSLSNVAVYGYAMTAQQVAAHYAAINT